MPYVSQGLPVLLQRPAGRARRVILESVATATGVLLARHCAHRAILHGLRAPRVLHDLTARDLGVSPDRLLAARIPGARGRTLSAWLVMPPGAEGVDAIDHRRRVPAVLVLHGWGSNAALMAPVVPPLHAAGLAVLLIDARCHGRSDGEPFTSMPRFAEDIAAGLAWLRQQPGIDAQRLALLGHSVGAAAALLHAANHGGVRAVVSLASFAHPREVMRRFLADKRVPYPVLGWYVLRRVQRVIGCSFDTIAPLHTITRVHCPVLLVHGLQDRTVPFADARRLQAACAGSRLLPVAGDHDLRDALGPHAGALVDFLARAFGEVAGPDRDTTATPSDPPSEPHDDTAFRSIR